MQTPCISLSFRFLDSLSHLHASHFFAASQLTIHFFREPPSLAVRFTYQESTPLSTRRRKTRTHHVFSFLCFSFFWLRRRCLRLRQDSGWITGTKRGLRPKREVYNFYYGHVAPPLCDLVRGVFGARTPTRPAHSLGLESFFSTAFLFLQFL